MMIGWTRAAGREGGAMIPADRYSSMSQYACVMPEIVLRCRRCSDPERCLKKVRARRRLGQYWLETLGGIALTPEKHHAAQYTGTSTSGMRRGWV